MATLLSGRKMATHTTMKACSGWATCVAGVSLLLLATAAHADDPLPSWNEGAAKKALMDFVRVTTSQDSPKFVQPEDRIATFDQDGTLWVEHPLYTQLIYCLDRVPAVVKQKPELKDKEPFKTVLSGDHAAI